MGMHSHASIDDYLAQVESDEHRTALERLRSIIREEAPDAQEGISYGMPVFKQNGALVYFASFKKHCSFFATSTTGNFSDELKGFKTSKGTIQFTAENQIPEDLVRRIVRARLAENLAAKASKSKSMN